MAKSTFVKSIALILLAAIVCATCLVSLTACKKKPGQNVDVTGDTGTTVDQRTTNGETYTLDANRELFLLAAVDEAKYTDAEGHELEGGRAVAIFIASVDKTAGSEKIDMIQLDQNTMADMKTFNRYGLTEGTTRAQLALAYAYGDGGSESGQNLLNAVKSVTGLPLTSYVVIKSSAMPALSRLSGDLTLTLTANHTDYDPTFTSGSTVTLPTSEFENFLREQSAGFEANRRRMARMRDFVPAFFQALAAKKDQTQDQFNTLKDQLQYNFSDAELVSKLQTCAAYPMTSAVTPNGTSQLVGLTIEFEIDAASLNQILINTCFKKGN